MFRYPTIKIFLTVAIVALIVIGCMKLNLIEIGDDPPLPSGDTIIDLGRVYVQIVENKEQLPCEGAYWGCARNIRDSASGEIKWREIWLVKSMRNNEFLVGHELLHFLNAECPDLFKDPDDNWLYEVIH